MHKNATEPRVKGCLIGAFSNSAAEYDKVIWFPLSSGAEDTLWSLQRKTIQQTDRENKENPVFISWEGVKLCDKKTFTLMMADEIKALMEVGGFVWVGEGVDIDSMEGFGEIKAAVRFMNVGFYVENQVERDVSSIILYHELVAQLILLSTPPEERDRVFSEIYEGFRWHGSEMVAELLGDEAIRILTPEGFRRLDYLDGITKEAVTGLLSHVDRDKRLLAQDWLGRLGKPAAPRKHWQR